jgi:phage baseplate assembly protein W|tara:strand:- start:850 stop:1251 length:402 start_codon:yes stop_codon:yes gene_type:complete
MPVERISKSFKDISLSLKVNPINYDLITVKNETAVARSIRNLIYTYPGEKFFNPDLGSRVSRQLFENFSDITAINIQSEIENTIQNYEPRVDLIRVRVEPNFDNLQYNVTIQYRIVGINVPAQELSFALQSVR